MQSIDGFTLAIAEKTAKTCNKCAARVSNSPTQCMHIIQQTDESITPNNKT